MHIDMEYLTDIWLTIVFIPQLTQEMVVIMFYVRQCHYLNCGLWGAVVVICGKCKNLLIHSVEFAVILFHIHPVWFM